MINPGRTLAMLGLTIALLLIPLALLAQAQRVEIQLSANRITVDESVVLSVRAYGLDKAIDYSSLETDFEVLARSSSRQLTIISGEQVSLVEWVLELTPKREGVLEIPPINVGPEQSLPANILVEGAPTGSNRDVYLEASVDDADPYVQSQIIYSLRVFLDVRLLDASLQVPEMDGMVMQQLSEEKSYEETVEGRTYTVRELRYSLFPESSGKIVIPPMVLKSVVSSNETQVPNTRIRTKRMSRRSNPVELNVQARPEGLAGSWWLPAKEVRIQSAWSESIDNLSVDQPVTRTISLLASGVADTQLPELSVPEVPNISIYADSPVAATNANENGLISQQTNTWAVIPQAPGELVLPEVQVNWFDTTTGEARVATLPEETLIVSGNAAAVASSSANSTTTSTQASSTAVVQGDTDALVEELPNNEFTGAETNPAQENPQAMANAVNAIDNSLLQKSVSRWRNIAYALLAGWVLSLIGLWLMLRGRNPSVNQKTSAVALHNETSHARFQRRAGANAALEPIRAACDTGDASKISKAVLAWGAMVWPENAPTNTTALAKRLQSAPLQDAFDSLDAEQFRPSGSVNSVAVDDIPSLIKRAVDEYPEDESDSANLNALPSL